MCSGTFVLEGVKVGLNYFRFTHLGYQALAAAVQTQGIDTIHVEMSPDPIVLEGIGVQVNPLDRWARQCSLGMSLPGPQELAHHVGLSASDFLRSQIGYPPITCATSGGVYRGIEAVGESGLADVGGAQLEVGGSGCFLWRGQAVAPRIHVDEIPFPGGLGEWGIYPNAPS